MISWNLLSLSVLLLKYPTLAHCQAAGPVKLRKLFYATGTKQQLEFLKKKLGKE